MSMRRIMRIMNNLRINHQSKLRWGRKPQLYRTMRLIRTPFWPIARSMRINPTRAARSGTWTWTRTLILYDCDFMLAPYNKSITHNKPPCRGYRPVHPNNTTQLIHSPRLFTPLCFNTPISPCWRCTAPSTPEKPSTGRILPSSLLISST